MSCLITLDNLKTLWNVAADDVAGDARFRALIEQCSARIETFCRRKFKAADYTEFLQGTGTPYIATRQRPINSVASVYEDTNGNWGQGSDPFPAATLLVAGTDYAIVKDGENGTGRSGVLYRVNGFWPKFDSFQAGLISPVPIPAVGNVKVTYNAGFTTIPSDVQQACAYLCAAVRRTIVLGAPTSSEGWEDYNYTLANAAAASIGGLSPDVLGCLANYRNTAWG